MKRIMFETNHSFGYFEIPDDAVLKIPKGVQVNAENAEDHMLPRGVELSTQGTPGARSEEDEGEHLIPPIGDWEVS